MDYPYHTQHLLKYGLLLCLLFSIGISAEATCSKGCPQTDNGILKYSTGNVYEYNFDSILTVGIKSDSVKDSDDTSLKVNGLAKINFNGNCGYTLQLEKVKVASTKESVEKRIIESIAKPVIFSLVNGKLEPTICADVNENENSLNIKRAIISLFQSNVEAENEVDVFGQCPTHTSISNVDNIEVITKVRNLNKCSYRENINSGFINGVINEKSDVKSTQLLQADYFKESKIKAGILDNVQLIEEYSFTGTPKNEAPIHAKVITNLKLKNSNASPAAIANSATESVSIIFQKSESNVKNIASLKTAISEVIQRLNDYVQKDSAKYFIELIRLMRNADVDTLLELAVVPFPNKVLARQVYLDALFRTGTSESAKAIIKQLNKLEEKEKLIAILSLNLVQVVDKDTLNLASTLLNPTASKETFMSVGNIVAKYCQNHQCQQSDVEGITKKFIDNLKHCKSNTKKDEDRIVSILKGIANAHYLGGNIAQALSECADIGRSSRIRVAALQAFPAAKCEVSTQKKALDLLRNQNEDSELRIEAYLALINCPSAELANDISNVVNNERVNQVGGFIASNLKALRDSTDSARENQRFYLGNILVSKVFPKDIRRYSYNNEVSYRVDSLGLSASSDYKLIYSQNGFLPRSAKLNISTELFGTNFNVIETSIRQENIESVLEYYLGPKGLLNKDFDEIINVFTIDDWNNREVRQRRSIADDTAKYAKKYKTYGNKNPQDINLDLSLKLFGSELLFLSLGDNVPSSLEDVIKHVSSAVDEIKKEISSFNKEFISHSLFLDSTFSYPTGLGIPLELSSQGFATNKIDVGISVDVDAILGHSWEQSKYHFKIIPSIDLNVDVRLGFNAFALSTGVRLVSSLHSASGGDINLALINDGNGFNLDVVLPREKLELINVNIEADFFVAEQDKPIKAIALKNAINEKTTGSEQCFDSIDFLGVTICFQLPPNAISDAGAKTDVTPWYHPQSLSVYVISEQKINLKGVYTAQNSLGNQQWRLDFSTPESKVSHDTSLTFELGTKEKTFGRLSLDNPQYHFAVEAGIKNDNRELVVYAQYENNQSIKKSKIGFSKNGNEYRPLIQIENNNGVVNDINGYRANGRVIVEKTSEKQSKYNFENFEITNQNNDRFVINGWADVGPAAIESELRISPGQQTYLVKGNLKLEDGEYKAGLFINDESTPDNVVGALIQVKANQQQINVNAIAQLVSWKLDIKNDFQYDKPENSNKINYSKLNNEITLKNKNNIVGAVKINVLTESENKIEFDTEITRGKKITSLTVKLNKNIRAQQDYVLEMNAKLDKHFVDLLAKCDINGNRFIIDNVLTTSWGTSITVKGELGQRYTIEDIYVNLQGTSQFSGKDKPNQWILKIIGVPEKTNSEFKLLRDNAELIKYSGDFQHPQDKITGGKINLLIKNIITSKAEFKIAKNGKGDITTTIETLKTEPKQKIELNSKFQIQSPKYDIETTVTLNSDKKLYFKTENIIDKLKFSTKNVGDVAGQKITFDASGSVKGDWRSNGELQGNFIFTNVDGRVVDGFVKRKLTTNARNGFAQGNMELQLNDQLPNGGKKRSFGATGKLEKLNLKTNEVSAVTHLIYSDFDNKNLDISYQFKHLPKDKNKMLDFAISLNGELLINPISLKFLVDEYSAQHGSYQISGKYGEIVSINSNGNFNLGDRGVPAIINTKINIQAPKSTFKNIEVNINGKLLSPDKDSSGPHIIELLINEQAANNQFFKLNIALRSSQQNGAYNVELETSQMQGPMNIQGSYQRDQEGNIKDGNAVGKQKYTFDYKYANNFLKYTGDASYVGLNVANIHYSLDSSFESAKDIDVDVRGEKLDIGYSIQLKAKQASSLYTVDSKIYTTTYKKGVEVNAAIPSGEPIVIIGVFELLGERKAKVTSKIKNVLSLDIEGTGEASYKGVDDFYIIAQWNSAKLNLNNYDLNVRSQGKAISIGLKNAEGTIFSGSASYSLKNENNKAILEGIGRLQYKGKTQNTNFKLIRQVYDVATDKEIGVSYSFNGNLGPKNGVATLKLTNKDFNIKLSVCEERKQCTNLQVQSIITVDESEIDAVEHSFLVLIDLRELNYPYEFEIQSKSIKKGLKVQYNLDSKIISNNNLKYQLIATILPTNSKIQIKLPSREILLENQQVFPQNGQLFGHYENSVAFYFDKTKQPNDVTRLIASADITGVETKSLNVNGEIKFQHPSVRPLIVTSKLNANRQQHIINSQIEFDIFRLPEQKIVISSQVQNTKLENGFNITSEQTLRSSGLGLDYDFNGHAALDTESQALSANLHLVSGIEDLKVGASLYGNRDRVDIVIHSLNEPIIQLNAEFNRQKYASKLESKLQLIGQYPIEIESELQPGSVKLEIKRENLFEAETEIKLGKEIKYEVEGAGKKVLVGRVSLDSVNFLQTSYKCDKNDIQSFLSTLDTEFKKDTKLTLAKIKTLFNKLRETIDKQIHLSSDSVPDFSLLKQNYQNNANDIVAELENDPNLKQVAETYRELYTKIVKITTDISDTYVEFYEKIQKSLTALYGKLEIILRDSILPIWEEFLVIAAKIIGEWQMELVKLLTKAVQVILDVLEKFRPSLKNYGKVINESLKPFNDAIQEVIKVSARAIEEILNEIKEYVSKLPTFDAIRAELKELLEKLKLADNLLKLVNDLFEQLHLLPQTPEVNELLQKTHSYLESKLKKQPINDEALIAELFKLLIKALRSLWPTVDTNSSISQQGVSELISLLPFSLDIFEKLPTLLSFRLSIFNFLLNENWEDIFQKDHFSSWIFFNDFDLKGHIADGHHIFTFDGQHYSISGSCKYILAQDSVDNNFTVIAQLNNGKLKSITLTDREGSFIEVNDAGVLKLKGNPVEFPQHNEGIHAWRLFYTVWLHSDYGVEIMCTNDLKVCHVDVNGFYTSKVRGLLGNGNAEPNDDFIQADGKIAPNSAAFGNGYSLGKCNPIPVNEVPSKRADICSEIFGLDSSLAVGYLFENPSPYRDACDEAVAEAVDKDKETAACTIATAYGSALKKNQNYVLLPTQCLKCVGAAGQRDIGQEFTVKIPNNKADIVFVVDLNVPPTVINNLVAPAVNEIREALKTRGLSDIQISVVAYNESERYPALLTSDNGKLNYAGNLESVQLNGPKNIWGSDISQLFSEKKVLEIYELLEDLVKSIEPQSDELAYKLALSYPFRAGAAKSIVGVRSKSLEYDNLFKFVRTHIAGALSNSDGAILHLIGPVNDFSLEGIPSEKLIGFNTRLIATLDGKDAKKRQKLQFQNDLAIDLVLDNGGWIFATQNIENLKPQDQRKALNQITNSIADTLFKTEIVSDCKCTPAHGLHAHHKCSVKSSNFVPNKKVKQT